ncbi:MAG: hypothetical protein NTX50_04775 [Candidatus Sumerlaeota bacterium]|nr:hypothetical protein [Candidatus Sumerlaeota bacterium]
MGDKYKTDNGLHLIQEKLLSGRIDERSGRRGAMQNPNALRHHWALCQWSDDFAGSTQFWPTIIAPLAQGPVVAARLKRSLLAKNHRSTGARHGGGGGQWKSGSRLFRGKTSLTPGLLQASYGRVLSLMFMLMELAGFRRFPQKPISVIRSTTFEDMQQRIFLDAATHPQR